MLILHFSQEIQLPDTAERWESENTLSHMPTSANHKC